MLTLINETLLTIFKNEISNVIKYTNKEIIVILKNNCKAKITIKNVA